MATVFRPPIFTRIAQPAAALGWTFNGTIYSPTGPVQTPLNKTPIIDPVRFVANPWPAINSQWYIETSNQGLYLKSLPVTRQITEVPRGYPPLLLDWVWPSSQNLYLRSTPLSARSTDLPQIAGRLLPTQGGSPTVLLTGVAAPSLPPGKQLFDLRVQPNPWASLSSQPFGSQLPLAGVIRLPPGGQSLGPVIQPYPWVAIRSQDNAKNNPGGISVPGSEYIYYAHHKGIR